MSLNMLMLMCVIAAPSETETNESPGDPILLAHRGLVQHAPENTLPSFAAAIELGLSIELDVYQTRDEHLVVIHDKTVDRTTNGTGEVTEMTLAEIRKLDAGSWFDPRFAGAKVPTLEEVFKLIHEHQRTPVTIALNMKVISPGIEAEHRPARRKVRTVRSTFRLWSVQQFESSLQTSQPEAANHGVSKR